MLTASLSLLAESGGMWMFLLSVDMVGSTRQIWHMEVHRTTQDAPKVENGASWCHCVAALYAFRKVVAIEVGSWWLGKGRHHTDITSRRGSRELRVAQTPLSPWEGQGNLWGNIWSTMSSFGLSSTRKTLIYWSEFNGGPQKWLDAWSTRRLRRGWESWVCHLLEKRGLKRDLSGIYSYLYNREKMGSDSSQGRTVTGQEATNKWWNMGNYDFIWR